MPINSPNMNLPIPVVGVDPSPTWATLLDQCLTIVDGHNHTNGSGVPITPGAINISSDLTFNSNNAIALRASRFTVQASPITASGSDLNEIYVSGVDLYYNDGNGNQVRITQSGGIAGSPGSISNLTSPASAAYVAANGVFVWQQAANTSADMDFGSAIMRNDTASSFALTLQPPTLGSDYSITLPALPNAQKIMTMDASGIMSAPWSVDGSTVAITSNVLGVPSGGIGTTQLASQAVTAAKIANGTITDTQIQAHGLTGASIVSSINLPGNAAQENGMNLVVSAANASTSLKVLYGVVNSNGSILFGTGFSISHTLTGQYAITFTSSFASTPAVLLTANTQFITGYTGSLTASSVNTAFISTDGTSTLTNSQFSFIAIGPR